MPICAFERSEKGMEFKMKKIIKSKPIKMIIIFIIFTIIYMLTFHLNVRKLIPVYTYYGIISLCILTIILGVILWIFTKKKIFCFDIKDSIITLLLCFFINIFVFCMVPVTLERSISVFMLNDMNNKGNEYTKEEIEQVFIDKYVYEYEAFEKRFEEQLYTGTISYNQGKYTISDKGKKMVDMFYLIKILYNVTGKILE